VVAEARRRRANLIVSHHPLLFRPLRTVVTPSGQGAVVAALARHGISAYAAHTNLDFAPGGTSHALAELLGLRTVGFLSPLPGRHRKVVTFVPATDADRVMEAMAAAGAGVIGEYGRCSFRTEGTGTFHGSAQSHPVLGRALRLERVPEVRLEMVAPAAAVEAVAAALRAVHPYEEPAFDVYPLEGGPPEFGMGAVGELPSAMALGSFLDVVRRRLRVPRVRYTGEVRRSVRRVAVCGGSGADLLPEAIRAGAEVFVTADVKYHAFHEASGRIALVDAGHHETEFPVVAAVAARLRAAWTGRRGAPFVATAAAETNPVRHR
jgi:dinuclear metal center YbgI/SA1388 family protein